MAHGITHVSKPIAGTAQGGWCIPVRVGPSVVANESHQGEGLTEEGEGVAGGEGAFGRSLYFLHDFSGNLKLL